LRDDRFKEHAEGRIHVGNVLMGGLIGFIAVDPATGAVYRLDPKELDVMLVPLMGALPAASMA
jgi:hypothetical protein